MKKKLLILILLISVFHFIFRIYTYRESYLSSFDAKYWENRYLHSQWVTNPACGDLDPHINPKTCEWDDSWYSNFGQYGRYEKKMVPIGDDGLYAYAGWEYINGRDPTTLNAELPPFGKYIIGLTILIFKNQNIFALLSGVFVLFSFFIFNKLFIRDNTVSLLSVALFSFEPLFYTQLRAPFLDLLYLGLLLLTFYFYLKEKYIISAVFLGLMMATKSSLTSLGLVLAVIISYNLLLRNWQKLKKLIIIVSVSLAIFTLTYFKFFLNGHGLREFIGVQKWIINFYSVGAKGVFGDVWGMMATGTWHTWWGETTNIKEWQIIWPLLLITTLMFASFRIYKRKVDKMVFVALWIIVYMIFLSLIPTWPRYLLLALPFMYNLLVWVLLKNIPWKLLRH